MNAEELQEQLDALQSIYPELSVDEEQTMGVFQVQLPLDRPITVSLLSSNAGGRVVDSIRIKSVEPLEVRFSLPIDKTKYTLKRSWLSEDVLRDIGETIDRIIDNADDDYVLYTLCEFLAMDLVTTFHDSIFGDIQTDDFGWFREIALMHERARIHQFVHSEFQCCICLDQVEGSKGVLLHCDHSLCKHCMGELVQRSLDHDLTRLQCPSCPTEVLKDHTSLTIHEVKRIMFKETLSRDDLLNVMSPSEYEEYHKKRLITLFERYHAMYPLNSSQCPRCLSWSFHDDVEDQLMRCASCKLAYCFDCKHSWHGTINSCGKPLNIVPVDLVENFVDDGQPESQLNRLNTIYGARSVKLAIQDVLDKREMTLLVQASDDMVQCPRCGIAVTKTDGCNKMQCKLCKQNFCFLCGLDLFKEDPYLHFNDYRSPCYGRLFEGLIDD